MLMQEQIRTVCTDRTVLVVDDRDRVRGVLRAILESAGAHVLDAASAEQARILLERTSPDAVVTDLELTPNWRGGIVVLEHVRRLSASCPVVLLTGWSDELETLRTLGFDAVLLKPAAPADLIAAVASVMVSSERDSRRRVTAA